MTDSSELVERLRAWCIDWNGAQMVRGEPPRDGLHCDLLRDAAVALSAKDAEIERLTRERDAVTTALSDAHRSLAVFAVDRTRWRDDRDRLSARLDEAVEVIESLADAVTAEVNEKGGGGYILARLSDARAFLSAQPSAAEGEK